MSEIKWIHISDLHFGVEKQINEVSTIREKLFDFLDKLKRNDYKYLFISGDIFYAPIFFKDDNEKEKNEIIDKAIFFIIKLIHELKIDRENVFIVPGNHDTDRMVITEADGKEIKRKEEYIRSIRLSYNNTGNLNITELKKYQKYFNQFCEKINNVECENYDEKYDESKEAKLISTEELKKINYCDAGHKLVKREDIDVLMLNSSLSSCQDRDELLLGVNLLRDEIKKIEQIHLENDSFPLFVLSHHYTECFKDKHILITELKEKKDTVLYLCGHEHSAEIRNVDGIDILQCGTYVSKEKEDNFKPNEVSFLTGSFDKTLSETKVFFYKWHFRQGIWIKNRDVDEENFPHYIKTIEKKNNHKKYVLFSKSESEAIKEFFIYLKTLETEIENKHLDDPYTFFINKINEMLELIESKHPAWKFKDKFKEFNLETNIEGLQKKINVKRKYHENVKKQINSFNNINILVQKIKNKRIDNPDLINIGILLYSKSVRVTDYLLKLLEYTENIDVYICSGDIRSTNNLYEDGHDIAHELYDDYTEDFKDIKGIQLIPDIYVERLMREGKVQFVLMGAHSLYYGGNGFTDFGNTTGSKLIMDLARKNKAECLIIAEISKADNIYPVEICEEKDIIDTFTYPTTTNIKAEFYHHEVVDIKEFLKEDLITIITDTDKHPWADSPKLTSGTIETFTDKILKDRRELKLNDENTTIEKHFLPEDKKLEIDVLETLSETEINVPKINDKKEDCIVLNYYKGIRIFNFIVSIDNLKNEYGEGSKEYEKLNKIAKKLLSKCEDNQKKIQLILYNKFKNSDEITKYPIEKLTDIIELLFSCIKLDAEINKEVILKEMGIVYNYFQKQAKVPFRDASIKNMILVNDDLYLGKFKNENERNNYIHDLFKKGELEKVIDESNIIDIDFSLCIHYSTPYDDIISFRFHERTAPYFSKKIEVWNNDLMNEEPVNKDILVATFIIRFLRFGGRKLLYRIIAPDLREKRFKHDNESYYFKELLEIIKRYDVTYLPESIKLFEKIKDILTTENRKNFFIIQYDDKNIEEKINKIRKKETYSDVFPY